MRLTESQEECIVEFTRLLSREFAPPLLVDVVFASMLEIGRRGTGRPLHALRVELRRNPAHREIHEAHYSCRVKFKAPRNAIVFRTADLDRPFVSYNAELLAMLGGQLERELAEQKVWQTTVAGRGKASLRGPSAAVWYAREHFQDCAGQADLPQCGARVDPTPSRVPVSSRRYDDMRYDAILPRSFDIVLEVVVVLVVENPG